MKKYIIDTNVAIVANNKSENVSLDCVIASIDCILSDVNSGIIILDDANVIQSEYRRYLNPSGQPGVGDRFYQEVIRSNPSKVKRVNLIVSDDGNFIDLPEEIIESGFDPSDRVFAALSIKEQAKVCNAVDTDWVEKLEILTSNGVSIDFLCGCDPKAWRH